MYANKLVTARRAIDNCNTSRSQVRSRVLPIFLLVSIRIFSLWSLWWRGFKALLSRCVPFSLIDVGSVSSSFNEAVKTLPTSIKEKRMPRAEAPGISFTKDASSCVWNKMSKQNSSSTGCAAEERHNN
eukprot:1153050-Pelagomonas_calceolata.AAC.19